MSLSFTGCWCIDIIIISSTYFSFSCYFLLLYLCFVVFLCIILFSVDLLFTFCCSVSNKNFILKKKLASCELLHSRIESLRFSYFILCVHSTMFPLNNFQANSLSFFIFSLPVAYIFPAVFTFFFGVYLVFVIFSPFALYVCGSNFNRSDKRGN